MECYNAVMKRLASALTVGLILMAGGAEALRAIGSAPPSGASARLDGAAGRAGAPPPPSPAPGFASPAPPSGLTPAPILPFSPHGPIMPREQAAPPVTPPVSQPAAPQVPPTSGSSAPLSPGVIQIEPAR